MDRVIGIDLGTTNSCVAVVDGDTPTVIPNRGGYKTMPSMVAVTEAGKRLVGHNARRQSITNARHTISAAKRLMGRKWDSLPMNAARETASFQMVPGPHNDVRVVLRNTTYSIPEISAMILSEMRQTAEDYLGEPVSKAVITVPAYFSDAQRQATRDAGQIAGLDVIRIINEPTAAALAYGFGNHFNKLVAVYDLGGGTFDVSILEIGAGDTFKVIATAGDTFLGGEDFDAKIIDWLVGEFEREHGINLRSDPMALQRLKDAAETAKRELSTTTRSDVSLPFVACSRDNEALHLQCTLTRQILEGMCHELVQRTIDICRQTLFDAGLSTRDVQDVLLVGGMTRMPAVQRAVADFFGMDPCKSVHPDEVVALGAAIQGRALVDESQKTTLFDVTPHALGIMTYGSLFEQLIPQNTIVPTEMNKVFTTSRDNQTAVRILVMQGESQLASDNELLGEFVLTGLRSAPRGQVEVDVSFAIDADGIVSVAAVDVETGKTQSIQVTSSSGLTKEELAEMIHSANQYTVECRANEQFEQVSQQAQSLISEIEHLVPAVQSTVGTSDFGKETIERARQVIEIARRAIEARDTDAIRGQLEALTRSSRLFRGLVDQPMG